MSADVCRGFLLHRFWRILPEIFLEEFSGQFWGYAKGEGVVRRKLLSETQKWTATFLNIFYRGPGGPPQFHEKRSRSEKAILGALGEFRGILGATVGIRKPNLGMRNSILGMASHDLSNTKNHNCRSNPRSNSRNFRKLWKFFVDFSKIFRNFRKQWIPTPNWIYASAHMKDLHLPLP